MLIKASQKVPILFNNMPRFCLVMEGFLVRFRHPWYRIKIGPCTHCFPENFFRRVIVRTIEGQTAVLVLLEIHCPSVSFTIPFNYRKNGSHWVIRVEVPSIPIKPFV
jgi:hypothetical protein